MSGRRIRAPLLAVLAVVSVFRCAQALPRGARVSLVGPSQSLHGTGAFGLGPSLEIRSGARELEGLARVRLGGAAAGIAARGMVLRGGAGESSDDEDEVATGSQASAAPGVLPSGEALGDAEEEWDDTAEAGSTLEVDSAAPATSIKVDISSSPACRPQLPSLQGSARPSNFARSCPWDPESPHRAPVQPAHVDFVSLRMCSFVPGRVRISPPHGKKLHFCN